MKYSKISIHTISTNAVNLSKEALALDVTMIKKELVLNSYVRFYKEHLRLFNLIFSLNIYSALIKRNQL